MIVRLSLIILIVLSLSACANEESKNDQAYDQLKDLIENQNKQIEDLKIQIEDLKQSVNQGELIHPYNQNNQDYFMNTQMPFGISLINESDLPIHVYAYNSSLSIYYENEVVNEHLLGFKIVPKDLVKENNINPDSFDTKDVVKVIDENFVVVKVISLGTDLDEDTYNKVKVMLDSIEYY